MSELARHRIKIDAAGRVTGVTSKNLKTRKPRFEVYQDKRKQWRWRLVAANNRTIAHGESHTRERDAWRAVETVREAVALAVLER